MKIKTLMFGVAVMMLMAEPSMANEAFDMANERAEGILGFLTGPIATTVIAIVLTVVGFIMLKGWIAVGTGVSILTGAIVIGSSAHLAAWFTGG